MNPVELFKCLADETRLKAISLIVLKGELCVCDLVSSLQLSQPKISRHLAQLRNTGILLDSKRKQWVYYRINPQLPSWFEQVLQVTVAGNEAFLAEAKQTLAALSCCDTTPDLNT